MYPTAGVKLISLLTKSSRINTGANRYYSVMNDGSSSAKTMDEKEFFVLEMNLNNKVKIKY